MTLRQPPPSAGQLLKRLVPTQDHDALLGDLNEEFQRGRSVVWYWAQILAAIVVGSWKDVRTHPLVVARAAVTGIICQLLLAVAVSTLRALLTGAGFMWGHTWIGLPWYWWPYSPDGDLVLRAVWFGGQILIGWLILHLYRGHGLTMVLACCTTLGALRLTMLVQLALSTQWPAQPFTFLLAVAGGHIRDSFLMLVGANQAAKRGLTAGRQD
jgi:hypothetical protein